MSPLRIPSSSTSGSFSILCARRISCASERVVPTGAVMRLSLVITSEILALKSVRKRISLFVMIPTSLPLSSTIGTPEILNFPIRSSASLTIWSSVSEKGFTITPFSERLTLSTSSACCSIDIFLWMIPIPPSRAIAIAMRESVTVSIAAVMIGVLSLTVLVRLVPSFIILGVTFDSAGIRSTSSNVRPSFWNLLFMSVSILVPPSIENY